MRPWFNNLARVMVAAVVVLAAGVCRTDLEIIKGYMDFRGVLGHEFVGRALEGRHKGRRRGWDGRSSLSGRALKVVEH